MEPARQHPANKVKPCHQYLQPPPHHATNTHLLLLDLVLERLYRVSRLDVNGDSLSRQRLDEELHTPSQANDL